MKRFALMLLAFTMLFVMASAEESFVEEDFAAAASFDDEFFAEETFFGDEFEAEQPEVEDEVEDRSVYLFEDELRPEESKLAEWQKWEIKDLKAETKKNKVTLKWSVTKAGPSDQPSAQGTALTKKELKAQKGVKIFVYQIDANNGVPTEVKRVAVTKNKVTVTVKNPGTYYYFIRLEKVDKKSSVEDLGIASNKAEAKVGDIKNSKAVSKVKVSANVYAIPSSQPSAQPTIEVDVFADIYTKEADEKYTITAQQKGGELYTGTLSLSEAGKERVFANGVIKDVWLETEVDWDNNKVPKFEANGKKITVSAQSSVMKKAKKGSATPKAITKKTKPEIVYARQLSANTIVVGWDDEAAAAGLMKPDSYTLQIGKKKYPVKLELDDNGKPKDENLTIVTTGTYEYTVEGYPENTKKKAQNLKITVKADLKGAKKSKAYKLSFLPASLSAIMNADYDWNRNYDFTVTWNSFNKDVNAFEVYATDTAHSGEVYKPGEEVKPSDPSAEPSSYKTYTAKFKADELRIMTKGRRLSFTIKAVDGTTVLGRQVIRAYNPFYNQPSGQPTENPSEEPTENPSEEPTEDKPGKKQRIEVNKDAKTAFVYGEDIDPQALFIVEGIDDEDIEYQVYFDKGTKALDFNDLPVGKFNVVAYATLDDSIAVKTVDITVYLLKMHIVRTEETLPTKMTCHQEFEVNKYFKAIDDETGEEVKGVTLRYWIEDYQGMYSWNTYIDKGTNKIHRIYADKEGYERYKLYLNPTINIEGEPEALTLTRTDYVSAPFTGKSFTLSGEKLFTIDGGWPGGFGVIAVIEQYSADGGKTWVKAEDDYYVKKVGKYKGSMFCSSYGDYTFADKYNWEFEVTEATPETPLAMEIKRRDEVPLPEKMICHQTFPVEKYFKAVDDEGDEVEGVTFRYYIEDYQHLYGWNMSLSKGTNIIHRIYAEKENYEAAKYFPDPKISIVGEPEVLTLIRNDNHSTVYTGENLSLGGETLFTVVGGRPSGVSLVGVIEEYSADGVTWVQPSSSYFAKEVGLYRGRIFCSSIGDYTFGDDDTIENPKYTWEYEILPE